MGNIVDAGIFFENNNLIIERAKKEDEGFYLCKATNELGEVSTAALITVEGKLETPAILIISNGTPNIKKMHLVMGTQCRETMETADMDIHLTYPLLMRRYVE